MKIEKINIPEDKEIGLHEIKMSKLQSIVLIAGKNGAGKSRLLNKIRTELYNKPNNENINRWKETLKAKEKQLNIYEANLENAKRMGDLTQERDSSERIEQLTGQIKTLNSQLSWDNITTDAVYDSYPCVDFIPKGLKLKDCNEHPPKTMLELANMLDTVGLNGLEQSVLSKIQVIQDKWFNASHPQNTSQEDEKEKLISDYDKLQKYISQFLKTELSRDNDGSATLFGFKLGQSKLSDGQIILLQLCIAIYSQGGKIEDYVLFLDEPENHLHPEALIEVVDKLCGAVTNGQIWIATHSINLLAHFDPSCIWYMEDGRVQYSGNLPQRVLKGLIGNDEEIARLSSFLALPEEMANHQFAFECLFQPQSVQTDSDDPQTNQIVEAITKIRKAQQSIKVLDFGAGKGRLLTTIQSFSDSNSINDWLDYYAYDLDSPDVEICQKAINSIYDLDDKRHYTNEKPLLEGSHEETFDLIVLCNVFHEVEPKDWIKTFGSQSLIYKLLKPSGVLLIVEDQLLAVGEKAYSNGFLVLDKIQFKKLYKLDDYPILEKKEGRLRAHFIPRESLVNIDAQTRKEAITSLLDTSKREIAELRNCHPDYKTGRLHAFWTHQLANATLSLEEL